MIGERKVSLIKLLALVTLLVSSCNTQICFPGSNCTSKPTTYTNTHTNQTNHIPQGAFRNKDGYYISFQAQTNQIILKHNEFGNIVSLNDIEYDYEKQRNLYSWHPTGHKYQYKIAWQPKDPNIIRLQIFSTKNEKEVENTILKKYVN